MWIIFSIGLGNFFYSQALFTFIQNSFRVLYIFQLYTLSIGIIPVVVITLLTQNYLLKRNSSMANAISGKLTAPESSAIDPANKITLIAENQKDEVELPVNNILFIEAEGNYVSVVWTEDNEIQKTLLRSTLKSIIQQVSGSPYLFRCHRAFIVNIKKIAGIKGNAQGYKLNMHTCNSIVPVSRNYIHPFKHLVEKIK
jgi:DNA-binding LytR/AlgR family response regulator